jgi:hypothetical protein
MASVVTQGGYVQSTDSRGHVNLLVLGDSALRFRNIAATSLEEAHVISYVQVQITLAKQSGNAKLTKIYI